MEGYGDERIWDGGMEGSGVEGISCRDVGMKRCGDGEMEGCEDNKGL